MVKLMKFLLFVLPALFSTADGDVFWMTSECRYSSEDLHDMEYIETRVYNKLKVLQYNSTLGKFEGYTELGVKNAERFNKDTAYLQGMKADLENYCKFNAKLSYQYVHSHSVEPQVKVRSVKKAEGSHPAMLVCSAFGFYPSQITVTWVRNGSPVKGGQTSSEEMADGDWYYQIHSHLEYKPESGEEISCVVEHASFTKPMSYKWDPSMPEPDKSKIAIGASGLVLGIVLSAAGFIYYKKKSSGRILVPT